MAEFPCPYCGHAVATDTEEQRERCPSCDGGLHIAYRYRLVAHRGDLAGGELYEARDDGFDEKLAVLFVEEDADKAEVERFVNGNRMYAELGGGRGVVRILEVGGRSEKRPYVVMDWLADGTLESRVSKQGPLDHATLLETIGDLLTGLSRAHRSMPSVVHNHIHPGKIGFLSDDEIVMFGFEWAEQVFEQDSSLADTFIASAEAEEGSKRAQDLRQFGRTIFYAATGEWISDLSIMEQRSRARERLSGPIASVVDRLLDAGASGYRTAVDATMDFETLLRGEHSSWRSRILPSSKHGDDVVGSEWGSSGLARPKIADYTDEASDSPKTDYYESGENADENARQHGINSRLPPSSPSAVSRDEGQVVSSGRDEQAYRLQQQQLQQQLQQQKQAYQVQQSAASYQGVPDFSADAQAVAAKAPKLMGVIMAVLIGMGMCVASIGESMDDDDDDIVAYGPAPSSPDSDVEQLVREIEMQAIQEAQARRLAEIAAADAATVAPVPVGLAATFHYEGTINGPQDIAGDYELGDRCDIWVAPNPDENSRLNCRWYIDCGKRKRRIYGGGTVGFSVCEVDEEGFPVRAQDEDDDAADGAFVAELAGPAPMVMVLDRWLTTPTHVAIRIDEGGGPHLKRIPNVRLADRLDGEAISAAIARDEYPSLVPADDDGQ